MVGPLLVNQTRLLRVRQGILLVGCWQVAAIPNLRLSAEATWPQVQERIKRMLNLDLQRIEIVHGDAHAAARSQYPRFRGVTETSSLRRSECSPSQYPRFRGATGG